MGRRRVANAIAEQQLRSLTSRAAQDLYAPPVLDEPWEQQNEQLVAGQDRRPYLVRTVMTRSSSGEWCSWVQVEPLGWRPFRPVTRAAITIRTRQGNET
jgi:hypothetical protein